NLNISAENGYIKSEGTNLNSDQGNLLLISKDQQNLNTTNLVSGKDIVLTTTSDKGDIVITSGSSWRPESIQSTNGNIIIDSKGVLSISTNNFNNNLMNLSGNKIELFSKNGLNLDGVRLNSKEN